MNGTDIGSVSQTLSPGTQYVVTFFITAGKPNAGPSIKHLQAIFGGTTFNTTFDDTGLNDADIG